MLVLPILLPLVAVVPSALVAPRVASWVTLAASGFTLAASLGVLGLLLGGSPRVYWVGDWAPPYGIVLVADLFGALLAVATAAVAFASALHTAVGGEKVAHRRLYHPLFLLLLTSLSGLFLTGDIFNLYVFMEIVVLSSVVLVAMARRPVSAETTFKYLVLSALGSTLLLASIAVVYAGVGTLNIADIALRVRQGEDAPFWPIAGAMMFFAFVLKGAIFPFHFWQPDAHSAAPSPVSAMLSGIMVKVGFYGIVRMATLLFPGSPVLVLLIPLGAASALFGALAALANSNLKRVLAYSTIANMGLILVALGLGGELGLLAALVNAVNHALIKGSLFLAGGFVTEHLEEQELVGLGGASRLSFGTAVAFGLGAFALAGLPPLSGFLSKLTLFQAGLSGGDLLAMVAIVLASAIGIAYSVRAFVRVFWGELPECAEQRWQEHGGRSGIPLAPLLLVLCFLALGLWPAPLMEVAALTAAELSRPEIYIRAVLGEVE